MAKYKAAVLGCGAIFNRHLAALKANAADFDLIGVYDSNPQALEPLARELAGVKYYTHEEEVYQDSSINFIIILTPSHLHYTQAMTAIKNGKSVLIEKPVAFKPKQVLELEALAKEYQVEAFCVLQVRLNPSITIARQILAQNLLGDIRGASLVQRWQRPIEYFSGWRGSYASCGGVLYEFGIHYLDIMQYLLGVPKVVAARFYKAKFQDSEVSDSAYAIFDFANFGATMEISLAAEPKNIDLSLTIMGSEGYIKLGGKSLDQIIAAEFLNPANELAYKEICQNVLGVVIENQVTIGACPHHPELYKQIIQHPELFTLRSTHRVIELVDQINALDKSS